MPFLQLLAHEPGHVALFTDISGSVWSNPAPGVLGRSRPILAMDGDWLPAGQAAP